MPVEPFDVTDDNGIRVQGTAEATRDPNGDYYKPGSPYYLNPRYAERHFAFFESPRGLYHRSTGAFTWNARRIFGGFERTRSRKSQR
jgi:hypothetical protein